MKKRYNSALSLLSRLAVALLMLGSSQLTAQIIPTKKTIPTSQKIDWREVTNRKNVTFSQVQAAFKKDWAGKKPKKGEGYKVFKRWEDYMAPRVYPSGNMNLPSSTYENFMAWQKSKAGQQSQARVGDAGTAASIANWTELNPNAKASGYDSGVGLINFVRFDPTNPNIMYVCSPDGGLWKSINGGTSWTTNTDFLPIIGCSDLVIDPTNTQTMYLATGDRENDPTSIGILKSTNGGTTWNPTGLSFPSQNGWKIRRLIMDPTNPQVMIAVLNVGVSRTTNGWTTSDFVDLPGDADLQDAEFKPGDPNTVYAIGKDFFKSTNKGVSWTKITSGLPAAANVSRALIAVTAANPNYVYMVYGNATGGYLGTFRSVDSGTSFTQRSSPTSPAGTNNILNCTFRTTDPAGQAGHDLAIVVSPTNAELVTIGGCSVVQSTDGGTTWALSSYWLGLDVNYPGQGEGPADYVHADIQSLDYLPGSNTTLFVTCDGGISRSTNNGGNWTDISNNLRVAQMTNVGQSALTPYNMITRLQDIGTLKNSNGAWSVTNGGDGEDGFIDRTNDNNIITSNPNGAFALSTDAGVTKEDITGLPAGIEFNSPIHQDPVNAAMVYAGGRPALYRSMGVLANKDVPWTALGTPAGSGGIKRFVIAPSNPQVIYVLKGNNISKSTNGGTTFSEITGTLPVGSAQATNLDVSNTDPNKVWVTFSGYDATAKVYKSVNGGTTWTNISAGLPNIAINEVVYSQNSATDAVYVGADIGVYYMDNVLPWTPFFTGLPNTNVTDLEIYYPTGKIRAATFGRGLWESDLFVAPLSYTITASAGPNGSISPTGAVNMAAGANQIFTITPAGGFAVQNVLVDGVSVGAVTSYTFTNVRATHTINATFAGPLSVTLTASATTVPSTGQVTLTALAAGGRPAYTYAFDGNLNWSDTQNGNINVLSGLQTGVHNFTVTVTDSSLPTPQIARATVSFTVTGGSVPVVSIGTPTPVVVVGGNGGGRLGAFSGPAPTFRVVRKSANARARTAADDDDFAIFHFARDDADERLEFDYEITGSATEGGVLTFDSQDAFSVGEFEFDLQVFGVSNLQLGGDKTLTLTLVEDVHYDVHPEDNDATITFTGSGAPAPFSITGVTTISCTPVNNRINLSFNPQYAGLSGEPVTFQVVNELSPTTASGPYTLQLYADNPTITLKATQSGTAGEVSFSYNWREACNGIAPGNTAPTVANPIPSQSATVGQFFSYGIPANTFTDVQTPNSLVLSVSGLPPGLNFTAPATISGTPSTTVGSPFTVNVIATDPGSLSVSTSLALTVNPASANPNPTGPFAITSVTTVNCTPVGNRINLTFNPQYAGLSGQAVTFSVVNELSPTTQAGPYSLALYADNPVLILKATQSGTAGESSFSYNWVAACNGGASFGITAVTMVSCQTVSAGQRELSFTPQYSGVNGQAITFSVANELSPTTAPGPYTLRLYTDNPVITLKASQLGTAGEVSFPYNWVGACNGGSGRIGVKASEKSALQVRVLGNPAQDGQVSVEVLGAAGQPLRLTLTTLSGQSVDSHQVGQADAVERHRFRIDRQSAGQLLLRVTTPTQSQTVKVIKPD